MIFEILNSLRNATLRKRVTKKQADHLAAEFFKIKITLEEVNFRQAFSLSLSKDLSFYDASYVYLAKTKRAKLLTLDSKMKKLT